MRLADASSGTKNMCCPLGNKHINTSSVVGPYVFKKNIGQHMGNTTYRRKEDGWTDGEKKRRRVSREGW